MRAYDAPMSDFMAETKMFVSITTLIMVSYITLKYQINKLNFGFSPSVLFKDQVGQERFSSFPFPEPYVTISRHTAQAFLRLSFAWPP